MKIFALASMIFFLIISVDFALAESDGISIYQALNQSESSSASFLQLKIFVHDINDNPIREATIIIKSRDILEIQGNHLFTDRQGLAIVQVNPGTYDISIQARNYQNTSRTVTIFNKNLNSIEFTLIPETGYDLWIFFLPVFLGFLMYICWLCESSKEMKFAFILFLLSVFIPLLVLMSDWHYTMFFYVSLFFLIFSLITFLLVYLHYSNDLEIIQKWKNFSNIISETFEMIKAFLTILAILSWSLIVCYFECENVETVVISDLNFLEFPVYILIGVTVGVLSYLMLVIKQTFGQLLPAYKKRSILWECTRRVIIAPYIAIMGIYLIFNLKNTGLNETLGDLVSNIALSTHFILLFSIFAGMFTSAIEEWIYNKVRNILSLNDSKLDENSKYNIEMSDFVKLGMNEDLIYRLYYEANIGNMQNLANSDAKNVSHSLKTNYSEKEIQRYVDLAKSYFEGDEQNNVN